MKKIAQTCLRRLHVFPSLLDQHFNQEAFYRLLNGKIDKLEKRKTGKELEILRRLLLFVQLKAVPPIINFPKGQGQDSDLFLVNKTYHYKNTKIQIYNLSKGQGQDSDLLFVNCHSPQNLNFLNMAKNPTNLFFEMSMSLVVKTRHPKILFI